MADAMAFMKSLKERELTEDDMEKVAGGKGCSSMTCTCTINPFMCG